MSIPSQTEYWNELVGPRWVDLQESLDRLLEPRRSPIAMVWRPRGLLLRVGPSAAPLAEADPSTRERVAERLRELLNDLEEEGRVVLPARSWLVRARP